MQIGMGRPDISLDMHTVLTHELTIRGSFRCVSRPATVKHVVLMSITHACCRYGPDVYRLSLDLVARGAVNLKSLITHRFVSSPRLRHT